MNDKTLAIIKPDAVNDKKAGEIITMISQAGFKIKAMRLVKLTKESAEGFYEIHKGKAFFEELIDYMTSGPCIPIALEKENAVEDYRKLIGATDPAKAAEGTIRKLFARNIQFNAVHGSDSDENAKKEISYFFSGKELLEIYPG
ncbi:MAG: nucleoside-diphosphate kinase [Ignavibacteria bacterium GWA2_35_9]|nr:MAG: nucleoside-diphosphate kinase [Ignavibacteria bacterium GWA2_35_9]OGU46018.1 MAG: nucleoside-diphosphate kinase [Ignavibacteria bacterium GWB2_36_8]OGU48325.1 MAG: nucleoside-diphosphate kinase [Ignavibacteria bacterium GWC2_36_12]OGV00393.1 MAG: nucleoside-diphosphate kinase [Ignavibacteria bacterium RIFOXYA2_FULL_37_17]OGV06757.1 MAG: nucleoside-diphosphate kinase [Ignavibacteria bacterium RIFOXYB2_FULL_36_7]